MSPPANTRAWPTPRLPVFGWEALRGAAGTEQPCLLDLPGRYFTTSGRASILLALEAIGVGAGDSVLLPTYHCPTMAAPAQTLGATPRFYALDETGAPMLHALEPSALPGVKAMLVAHLFGLPQPMAKVRRWCDERGIALIEDCAHAMFGSSDGRPVGSWGNAAIGSLTKFLPVPEGGCLVLQPGLAEPRLRSRGLLAQVKAGVDIVEEGARHGRLAGLNSLITTPLDAMRGLRGASTTQSDTDEKPSAIESGFAMALEPAHSALTLACRFVAKRMPRRRIAQYRRENYRALVEALSGIAGLWPLRPDLPGDAVPYVFPLWVDEPDPGYQRLRSQGIPIFRWDRLWPTTPRLPGDRGIEWSHHVIQIACHQDLLEADLRRIITAIKRVYAPSA